MKVSNMTSPRGHKVPNQFIISTADGSIVLDNYYWDYSVTTGRYRNEFLNEGIAETRKKIASGEYQLTNLNA
jgi:hypothetical protein